MLPCTRLLCGPRRRAGLGPLARVLFLPNKAGFGPFTKAGFDPLASGLLNTPDDDILPLKSKIAIGYFMCFHSGH